VLKGSERSWGCTHGPWSSRAFRGAADLLAVHPERPIGRLRDFPGSGGVPSEAGSGSLSCSDGSAGRALARLATSVQPARKARPSLGRHRRQPAGLRGLGRRGCWCRPGRYGWRGVDPWHGSYRARSVPLAHVPVPEHWEIRLGRVPAEAARSVHQGHTLAVGLLELPPDVGRVRWGLGCGLGQRHGLRSIRRTRKYGRSSRISTARGRPRSCSCARCRCSRAAR
jgi:hypothetical protein